jgi:hypothetical protein
MSQLQHEIFLRRLLEPLYQRLHYVQNLLDKFDQNQDLIVSTVQGMNDYFARISHQLTPSLFQSTKDDLFKLKVDIMNAQKYIFNLSNTPQQQPQYEQPMLSRGEARAIRQIQKDLEKGRAFETQLFHNGKRLYTGSTGGYFYYNSNGNRTYVDKNKI